MWMGGQEHRRSGAAPGVSWGVRRQCGGDVPGSHDVGRAQEDAGAVLHHVRSGDERRRVETSGDERRRDDRDDDSCDDI